MRVEYLDVPNPYAESKSSTAVLVEGQPKPNPGFKLSFHFQKNGFFSNAVLTKTYLYAPDIGYSGDFVYAKAIGCTIDWVSAETDLTREWEVRRQRNRSE